MSGDKINLAFRLRRKNISLLEQNDAQRETIDKLHVIIKDLNEVINLQNDQIDEFELDKIISVEALHAQAEIIERLEKENLEMNLVITKEGE